MVCIVSLEVFHGGKRRRGLQIQFHVSQILSKISFSLFFSAFNFRLNQMNQMFFDCIIAIDFRTRNQTWNPAARNDSNALDKRLINSHQFFIKFHLGLDPDLNLLLSRVNRRKTFKKVRDYAVLTYTTHVEHQRGQESTKVARNHDHSGARIH